LHSQAAKFLEQHEQNNVILSAWPVTDELTRPYLGYVQQPFHILSVNNFDVEELFKARQMRSQYQVAYLFSTKYESQPWIRSALWDKLNRRFFGYHRDVSPELAAEFLRGKIVFLARSKGEWVAILEMEQPSRVAEVSSKLLGIDDFFLESRVRRRGACGPQKRKHSRKYGLCHFLKTSQRKSATPAYQVKKAFWSKPNEFSRYTKDTLLPVPATQLLW